MSNTNNAKLTCFGNLVVHYSCARIEKKQTILFRLSHGKF